MLRGIVNHSNSESQLDSDRNIVNNRLSDTNRYEVLEKYDEVENEEIGTKSTKIVRVKNNLIKTVNQPSCELSNTFANVSGKRAARQ